MTIEGPNIVASRPTRVRWKGGAIIFLLCFVAYLDRIAFSVSASPIMKSLGIDPVQFGIVTTLFNVGYFLCQIPAGVLIQRIGPRKAMALSIITWSIFTACTGLANSLVMLAVTRFLFGAGEGPVFTAANSFFANWFPQRERGRANSLMNAGAFLAPALGAMLLVPVITAFGWNVTFFVCAALGVMACALWYFSVSDRPEQSRKANAAERTLIGSDSAPVASRTRVPWALLLRQRSFWTIAIGFFGTLWTIQFFIYWLPFYLEAARGVPFTQVGLYTSIAFVCITLSVLCAGALSDAVLKRTGSPFAARNLVAIGGLVLAAACLTFSTLTNDPLGTVLWLSLALGGAGFAQTLSWTMATDIGGPLTATVGSWMNTWGFVAAAIVPTVAPLVAKQFGWTQVILLNVAVIIVGIVGIALTKTNERLLAKKREALSSEAESRSAI
ncbi:MFS transporter [Paenarthrobacter sp. NPDC089675]|uniref:MFS transporter n=1 Tax=Paenarthrobacter sp. NPDC089675 TaxID=3364376 RepID=UPI0037F7884D